ncbi:NDP-hexose 2,3-dehydratase family protein [Amycolatopsis sp. NPDC059021]|uniref:NDP-hexose 2,3-dehydratase family protein n=1 Tax=Amycolatopsis sp. NPDC059021 TaxID=3346704 RepID=UPI00366C9470
MRNTGTLNSTGAVSSIPETALEGTGETLAWLAEHRLRGHYDSAVIPLGEVANWQLAGDTGDLEHESGRFFRVEGLDVRTNQGPVDHWRQPVIQQPEVGILGLLVRRVGGEYYALVQAKMEPGNINVVQVAPTVQATKSNYTRVHGGAATKYLEYFQDTAYGRVLVDVLQSEQGARFYRKRNRNVVVEVFEDVPVADGHRWLRLDVLRLLHRFDNVVNMCLRSVLSCLPLRPSMVDTAPVHTTAEVLSWFVRAKTRHRLDTRRVPLREVTGWRYDGHDIAHESGKYFTVVGVRTTAGDREVHRWSQPMVAPRHPGIAAFLTKRVAGVEHVLVQAKTEAGYRDIAELAPTVQCITENYRMLPAGQRPRHLEYVTGEAGGEVRFRGYQSEEGGRFYRQQNLYLITEVDPGFPDDEAGDYLWVGVDQLHDLVLHSNYLNIEARSLLSCLQAAVPVR